MSHAPILRVYFEDSMLHTARAGTFNFANVLKAAVEGADWRLDWCQASPKAYQQAPELDGYALFHMEAPTHDRALTLRRAYHYPFWQIEPVALRWRFDVALSTFEPDQVDPDAARKFTTGLRNRVLPAMRPHRRDLVLVPLQGRIRRCRTFQTMSPVEMLETVAATGRPTVATLHPGEAYDKTDHDTLRKLVSRYPNLQVSSGNTVQILNECAFVATQNSAVAFDGYLLGKPAVLFGQSDFHHIALNVADLGASRALELADTHSPDFDRYLYWFLHEKAINAGHGSAGQRILAAMRRGGWPI